jgi:hypothetical protein
VQLGLPSRFHFDLCRLNPTSSLRVAGASPKRVVFFSNQSLAHSSLSSGRNCADGFAARCSGSTLPPRAQTVKGFPRNLQHGRSLRIFKGNESWNKRTGRKCTSSGHESRTWVISALKTPKYPCWRSGGAVTPITPPELQRRDAYSADEISSANSPLGRSTPDTLNER